MPITNLGDVTYDDFKLNTVINPEHFDTNFQELVDKLDEVINLINKYEQTTDSDSGGDNVALTSITDLNGNSVQAVLEDFRNKLKAVTDSASGADFVGMTAISGLSGATIQSIVESLKTFVDTHIANTTTSHGVTGAAVGTTNAQTLTNKSINADNNTLSNIEVDNLKSGVIDADLSSVSASDDTIPSAKATKAYVDTHKSSSDHDGRYYTETEIGATADGSAGADKVGATSIADLTGATVQALLESLKDYVDNQSPLTIPNDSITELKMDDEMKKDIAGGVAGYDNFLNYANVLDNTFYADLEAYYGNTKLADDGQDVSDWTSGLGTLSQDTTNVKIGSGSIRITEDDSIGSNLNAAKNNITLDLSTLNNGETSSDDDFIFLAFYISNILAVGANGVQVVFDQASTYTGTNSKSIIINSGLVTGWNFKKIKKSSFSTFGTGSWSGIQSIFYNWNSTSSSTGCYVTFQLIQLVKKDPALSIPNPFQRNGVNDFEINSGEWFVGLEYGKIKAKQIGTGGLYNDLQGKDTFSDCIISSTAIVDNATYSQRVAWYIDTSNLLAIWVDDTNINLRKIVSGATTTYTYAHGESVNIGDLFNIKLNKIGSSITASVERNGVFIGNIYIEQSFSSNGYLGISAISTNLASTLSASITEIPHAHHADIAEVAKGLTEQAYCDVYSTAGQSIPNNTQTAKVFENIAEDNRNHFDGLDRLYIRESGVYSVSAEIGLESNSTGIRSGIIRINNNIVRVQAANSPSTGNSDLSLTYIGRLNVGDYIELVLYQNSGTTLQTTGAPYANRLMIAKIG